MRDASGLLDLMRNSGGAIGLSRIAPVIHARAQLHGLDLAVRLQADLAEAASLVTYPPRSLARCGGARWTQPCEAFLHQGWKWPR